jgi:outer membrane receptor protein involved in Fe transport
MFKGIRSHQDKTPVFSFNKKLILSSVISSLSVLGTQSVLAQDDKSFALEEILVTAQKRAESLQDVPIAVSAFSQEGMQDAGLLGGSDLEKAVPNLTFGDTGFGRFNFQIRGIGSQIQGSSADTGVGVHVNNIPITVNRFAQAEFFDMERVEVLRGPQGTLYGRNATGGVVNMITAAPENEFSAKLSADYGNYDSKRVTGHINVPISDTFAVRAAGFMLDRDGTVDNVTTGNEVDSRDMWSTRLTALWEPTDSFSAKVMWDHYEQDDSSAGNRKIICASDPGPTSIGGQATNPFTQAVLSSGCLATQAEDSRNNGGINSLHTLGGVFGTAALGASPIGSIIPINTFAGQTYSTDLRKISSTLDHYTISENDLFSLDMQFSFGDLTLSSITAYSEDENNARYPTQSGSDGNDFLPTLLTPGGVFNDPQLGASSSIASYFYLDQTAEQFSQELRLQSDYEGDFNFSVGGIYLDLDRGNSVIVVSNLFTAFTQAQNLGGAGIYVDTNATPDGTGHNYFHSKQEYDLKATALFGEAYYDINDTLKATVGLRYTKDEKSLVAFPIVIFAPGQGFPDTASQDVTFEEVTGRITLDWQATEDTLVYGSLSRGYKGGGFNPAGITGVDPSFAPEFVDAIEIGSKSSIVDGRGTVNLTAFAYSYGDYQIAQLINQSVVNENVDASIMGLEVESTFLVTESLQVSAALGYINSEIEDATSLDVYDLAQGQQGVTRVNSIDPATAASACLVPTAEVAGLQGAINAGFAPPQAMAALCSGANASPNASVGNPADLDGNELPFTPDWTVSLGAQYFTDFSSGWSGTASVDYYVQAKSYARTYNSTIDEIKSYDNLNLSYRIFNEESGLEFQVYARNLLSKDSITNIQFGGDTPGSSRTVTGKQPAFYGLVVSKTW